MAELNTPDKAAPRPRVPLQATPAEFDWVAMHPAFRAAGSAHTLSPQTERRAPGPNNASSSALSLGGADERPLRPQPSLPPSRSLADSFSNTRSAPTANATSSSSLGPALQSNMNPASASVSAQSANEALSHNDEWRRQVAASSSVSQQPLYQPIYPNPAPTQHWYTYEPRPANPSTPPNQSTHQFMPYDESRPQSTSSQPTYQNMTSLTQREPIYQSHPSSRMPPASAVPHQVRRLLPNPDPHNSQSEPPSVRESQSSQRGTKTGRGSKPRSEHTRESEPLKASQRGQRGVKRKRASHSSQDRTRVSPASPIFEPSDLGFFNQGSVDFDVEAAQQRSQSRAQSENDASQLDDGLDGFSSDEDEDFAEWAADNRRKAYDKELFRATQSGFEGEIIKPRGGYRGHRGPRRAVEPTADIKARLGVANKTFFAGDYGGTQTLLTEIIRINSETYEAWTLFASCFLELGQRDKGISALQYAAHLQPKHVEGWIKCAEYNLEEYEKCEGDDREAYLRGANLSYSGALLADPTHIQCRIGKAKVLLNLNRPVGAIREFYKVLKVEPCNLEIIREVCAAYYDQGEFEKAIELYKETFAQFMLKPSDYKEDLSWPDLNAYIAIYLQLNRHNDAIRELKSISRWLYGRGSEIFWDEVTNDCEWDAGDERRVNITEYEVGRFKSSLYGQGLPLELRTKLGISRLGLGEYEEAKRHFEWLKGIGENGEEIVFSYHDSYRQAADAYFAAKFYHLALQYYEPLKQIAGENTGDLHLQMGYCFKGEKLQVEAEECFQTAIQMDQDNTDARMELAKMYEALGEQEQAFIYVNEVMSIQKIQRQHEISERKRKRVPRKPKAKKVDAPLRTLAPKPTAQDAEGAVAEVSTVQTVEAPIVQTVEVPLARTVEAPRVPAKSAPAQVLDEGEVEPKRPKHKARQLVDPIAKLEGERNRAEQLQLHYRALESHREEMLKGDRQASRQWMLAARELTNDFRGVRSFYPFEKYSGFVGYKVKEVAAGAEVPLTDEAAIMAQRLSRKLGADISDKTMVPTFKMPADYRGITFNIWLDIFVDFGLCLARHGMKMESYEICEAARDCALWYHDRESMFLINLSYLICALFLCDEEICIHRARFFMKDYQFTTDSYRLFTSVARMVNAPVSWYSSGPSQKFILRQIKAMDFNLTKDPVAREKYFAEKASYSSVDEKGVLIINDELDIGLLMLYGHILYSSQSYVYALNYFLRAYALDPTNAMINLNVGLAYIHYALRRQADNRQFLILQGLTFMFSYYSSRKTSLLLDERQEAHYNIARVYHMLGLTDLAIPYYELVFGEEGGMGEGSGNEGQGESREQIVRDAAFNLQAVYMAAGNEELARRVTRRWLVI